MFLTVFSFLILILVYANIDGVHTPCFDGLTTDGKSIRGWDLADCKPGDQILIKEVDDDSGNLQVRWYDKEVETILGKHDTIFVDTNWRTEKVVYTNYRVVSVSTVWEENTKTP